MRRFHPLLTLRARDKAAEQIARDKGIGVLKARRLIRQLDDGEVEMAMMQATEECGYLPPGIDTIQFALGDGSIIQAILDWLRSPEGQAFISALVKILIGLLAGI